MHAPRAMHNAMAPNALVTRLVSAAMSDETPIAWLALEPGTSILTSDGEQVGKVDEVIADREKDIFSGITFKPGWLDAAVFVPAEKIESLTEGSVRLSLTASEAEQLEAYES